MRVSVVSIAAAFAGLYVATVSCVGNDPNTSNANDGGLAPTKQCNGVSVPTNDPATGCASESCTPCGGNRPEVNLVASCATDGTCASTCRTGFVDCNMDPADGCEKQTANDTANCGRCGNVCGNANTNGRSCVAGKCEFSCNQDFTHCGQDDASGCETNTTTDANNCGACGHSCLGGTCSGGKCQPVFLATGELKPGAIAVDPGAPSSGFVYWTNFRAGNYVLAGVPAPGTVRRVAKDGSLGTRITLWNATVGNANQRPNNVAVTPTLVYWTSLSPNLNASQVFFSGKDGTNPLPTPLTATFGGAEGITVDDANVYFTNRYAAPSGDAVWRAAFGQTTATVLHDFAAAAGDCYGIAAEPGTAGNVFFTCFDRGVYADAKTATSSTSAVGNAGADAAIALDATHAYWFRVIDATHATMYRAPKTGLGSPTPVVSNEQLESFATIAVDATYVYWTGTLTGEIFRAAKDGTGRVVIANNLVKPHGIAVDDGAVYFTEEYDENGRVSKLAKPLP